MLHFVWYFVWFGKCKVFVLPLKTKYVMYLYRLPSINLLKLFYIYYIFFILKRSRNGDHPILHFFYNLTINITRGFYPSLLLYLIFSVFKTSLASFSENILIFSFIVLLKNYLLPHCLFKVLIFIIILCPVVLYTY